MKFQLCLTTHGTVVWNTEAHKTLIPTGEGIFINSEQVHMAKPLGNEAAFFCIDISPDFLCPEKGNPLYQQKIQPVLEESGLDQKKITRQTISDYLRQYRIHRSLELLTESDISISQIAQCCGFSNQSYYTKEFRRVTGTTPKQYRLKKR